MNTGVYFVAAVLFSLHLYFIILWVKSENLQQFPLIYS